MKNYFLIFLYLLCSGFGSSQVLMAVISEVDTQNPIPYARIRVLHTNTDTIANAEGSFSFDLSAFSENDTLRISALGYENLDFLIVHYRDYFIKEEPVKIELTPKSQVVDEVVVYSGKSKKMVTGNNIKTPMISARFQDQKTGSEIGTVLKYNKKKKGHVVSLHFNIVGIQSDTFSFRVNLYDMKNGLPHKNILKSPIYCRNTLKDGIFSIDLTDESIFIKEDSFLALELIEDLDHEGFFINSGFLRSPSYRRTTGETEWKKTSVDLGFWAEIVYKK